MNRSVPTLILTLVGLAATQGTFAKGRDELLVSPFGGGPDFLGQQIGTDMDASLAGKTQSIIRNLGLDSRFQMKNKQSKRFNLFRNERIESETFEFAVDGFPVCDFQLKAHRSLDGKVAMLGDFPRLPVNAQFSEESFGDFEGVRHIVGESLLMDGKGTEFSVENSSRCLLVQGEDLRPVWRVDVMVSGLKYELVADASEVFSYNPKHFDANGSAKTFSTNATDGTLESFELTNMTGGTLNGYLVNDHFETCLPSANGNFVCPTTGGTPVYPFATNANLTFDFDPIQQSNEFIQASIFTNVNRALDWMVEHGYENFGGSPIRLLAHAEIGGDVNNALYQPGTPPAILVGDGDGEILANLGTDADVVSHELGHHVVYHTVTNISGESLVIHEALADFFTFARTGNACLGESICPDTPVGVKVCAVPRTCLRSGENSLTYGSPNLPSQAHLRGQFISGMLWDLYKTDGIPLKDVTTLSLKAIDLLVSNSGYKHLVVGMMLADHANFSGQYCSKILARAQARGLSAFLTDVNCAKVDEGGAAFATNADPDIEDFLGTGSGASVVETPSQKKKGGLSCGVINVGAGSGQFGGFLLLWIIPIIAAWIRRFRG